jgi:hypothetical protein
VGLGFFGTALKKKVQNTQTRHKPDTFLKVLVIRSQRRPYFLEEASLLVLGADVNFEGMPQLGHEVIQNA